MEDKKGCLTDQSKLQPKENILDGIIPLGADIDNNEIYDIKTGITIRRIDDVISWR
ncbi:MAG: hypothetical protein RR851_13015 [Clostridium sp.]